MKVSIIGQGYVGLPIAIAAAEIGNQVIGIDNNQELVQDLKSGVIRNQDLKNVNLLDLISKNFYAASMEISDIKFSDVILVCVPTPLDHELKPDLSYVLNVTKSFAPYVTSETLIIYESTVATGDIRDKILPVLLKVTGLTTSDIQVAYSPERIDPSNNKWNIKNTPKLISGINSQSCEKANQFYSSFISKVVTCSSIEIAETAKLLENSYRLINISFINEMSIFCQKLGIDINEVIKAASTKPYGFMPFFPSIGVGGHCIPVDPIYLSEKAKEFGLSIQMIELAAKINKEMPQYFVYRAEKILKTLYGKKVIVIGVAYKPNVADTRETPAEELILGLKRTGAEVFWHDDLVMEWNNEKSVALSNLFDLAILVTPHDYLDLTQLGDVPILNTRGSI
jgi:UDP-N-acetyl-D-glucosamine dehydrogenase